MLLTATIWGVAFVAQSVGMEYIGPFTFNAVRCSIGGAVLIPVIFLANWLEKREGQGKKSVTGKEAAQERKTLLVGGLSCGLIFFLATNFQQIGIMYTTVTTRNSHYRFQVMAKHVYGFRICMEIHLRMFPKTCD